LLETLISITKRVWRSTTVAMYVFLPPHSESPSRG
jgi:hypothetical protein